MHNVKTSLASLHTDWSVTPIGPQDANPTINAGVLTLAPRIDDGTPLIYFFEDSTFQDPVKDFGLVFKLALALDNNTNQPIDQYVVDLFGDVTDGQGNPVHPGFAHFHTGGNDPNGFTATGYVNTGSTVGALPDINAASRAVLTGNSIDPHTTETWAGGRVHQYEGSFQMIVTPLVQLEWANSNGIDLKTLPYTFKTEHFNPKFSGTIGNDILYGWETSNNDISGGSGHDLIMGTEGDDKLDGGDGLDRLFGGFDNDTLLGGHDADWLEGGPGLDILKGGDGDDWLTGGWHNDTIDGGAGIDTAVFSGNRDDYTVRSWAGKTTVTHKGGNEGTDTLTNVETLLFADRVDTPPPEMPVANPPSSFPSGVHKKIGTNKGDTLTGTSGADGIDGRDGNDTIKGQNGNDYLFGGKGSDKVDGGNGNDLLRGGDGADTLKGDQGNDKLFGDAGNDSLYGGGGKDELWGGGGNDTLRGEAGNDYLMGERGNDTLIGGPGDDTYVLKASGGNDKVVGFQVEGGDKLLFDGLKESDVTIQSFTGYTLFSWTEGSVKVDAVGGMFEQEYWFL
jgi:Ca2+-binding RTX toxin-like protein